MHTETASTALLGTKTGPEERDPIRIYVACLASYNSGILHGCWVTATLGEDHVWHAVREMLASSPEEGAEEWAIHDHDGVEGAEVSEFAWFDDVCAMAEFIEEHGNLGGQLLTHFGSRLDEAKAAFEDYAGDFRSVGEFAEELTDHTGTEIPDSISYYVDYDAMGRDMEMSGDIFTIAASSCRVHVFWSR